MISSLPPNTTIQLPGLPEGETRTIQNLGPNVLYYGSNPQVSPTNNVGSLSPGASVTLTGGVWLVSPVGTQIDDESQFQGSAPWEEGVLATTPPGSGSGGGSTVTYQFNVMNTNFAGGAKGDGVTDDTAAINAAITAAAASASATAGGSALVFFPPGYKFLIGTTNNLQILSGVILWCYGATITVPSNPGFAQGLVFYGGGSGQILTNAGIWGGTWVGSGKEIHGQMAGLNVISGYGCSNVTLKDRTYLNWGFIIDYPRNPQYLKILDNTIMYPSQVAGNAGGSAAAPGLLGNSSGPGGQFQNTVAVDWDASGPIFPVPGARIIIQRNFIHNSTADAVCLLSAPSSNLSGSFLADISHNVVTCDPPIADATCTFQNAGSVIGTTNPLAPSYVGYYCMGLGVFNPSFISSAMAGTLSVTTNGTTAVTLAAGSLAVPPAGTITGNTVNNNVNVTNLQASSIAVPPVGKVVSVSGTNISPGTTLLITGANTGTLSIPATGSGSNSVLTITAVLGISGTGIPANTLLTVNSSTTGTLSNAATGSTTANMQVGQYVIGNGTNRGTNQQGATNGPGTLYIGVCKGTLGIEIDSEVAPGFMDLLLADNYVYSNERECYNVSCANANNTRIQVHHNTGINSHPAADAIATYTQGKPVGTNLLLNATQGYLNDVSITDNIFPACAPPSLYPGSPVLPITGLTGAATPVGVINGNRFSLGPPQGVSAAIGSAPTAHVNGGSQNIPTSGGINLVVKTNEPLTFVQTGGTFSIAGSAATFTYTGVLYPVAGLLGVVASNGSTAVGLSAWGIPVPAVGTVLQVAGPGIPINATITVNSSTAGTLSTAANANATGTIVPMQVGSGTGGSGPSSAQAMFTGVTGSSSFTPANNAVITGTGSNAAVAGQVLVGTQEIQTGDVVRLTPQLKGGTQGFLSIGTINPGINFAILSSSTTDTSTALWELVH